MDALAELSLTLNWGADDDQLREKLREASMRLAQRLERPHAELLDLAGSRITDAGLGDLIAFLRKNQVTVRNVRLALPGADYGNALHNPVALQELVRDQKGTLRELWLSEAGSSCDSIWQLIGACRPLKQSPKLCIGIVPKRPVRDGDGSDMNWKLAELGQVFNAAHTKFGMRIAYGTYDADYVPRALDRDAANAMAALGGASEVDFVVLIAASRSAVGKDSPGQPSAGASTRNYSAAPAPTTSDDAATAPAFKFQ